MVGEFEPRGGLRRGGTCAGAVASTACVPPAAGASGTRCSTATASWPLLDGKGWGKRPVAVTRRRPTAIEPGLLLFVTFVVRGLAEDASSAGSGGVRRRDERSC